VGRISRRRQKERRMANTAVCKAIDASGLFDGWVYGTQYPDVLALGMNPIEHYVRWGSKLGRKPNAWFDTEFYLRMYPDVRRSGMNPFLHYIRHGRQEGRRPNSDGYPVPHSSTRSPP